MQSLDKQTGVALLMSLVILLVLTLLAVSGMQGSIMQERMSSAQRDGMLALEVAEAALREAESTLDGLSDLSSFGSTAGFYDGTDTSTTVPSPFDKKTWDEKKSVKGTEVDGITPRFMFEYKGKVTVDLEGRLPRDLGKYGSDGESDLDYARVIVNAPGPSGLSSRTLEGFYVFQLGQPAGETP